jgi:hypothetical protein
MKKLRLHLEDLQIDSFDTTTRRRGKGTVFGEQCTCDTQCTCPGGPTSDASCDGTCDGSCNGSCLSCSFSCDLTCPNTCGLSCGGVRCFVPHPH